jgi:hypothetical protein
MSVEKRSCRRKICYPFISVGSTTPAQKRLQPTTVKQVTAANRPQPTTWAQPNWSDRLVWVNCFDVSSQGLISNKIVLFSADFIHTHRMIFMLSKNCILLFYCLKIFKERAWQSTIIEKNCFIYWMSQPSSVWAIIVCPLEVCGPSLFWSSFQSKSGFCPIEWNCTLLLALYLNSHVIWFI